MLNPNTRLGRRAADLRVVQRASAAIAEFSATLDAQLVAERRPSVRMRLLREATNQITRTANDAIQSYRRASAAVQAEFQIPGADRAQAEQMRALLDKARADMLGALEVVSHRYAWADPWPPVKQAAPELSPDEGVHGVP